MENMENAMEINLTEGQEMIKETLMGKDDSSDKLSSKYKKSKYHQLEKLEDLVVGGLAIKRRSEDNLDEKLAFSYSVSSNGNPFLCMWQPMNSRLRNKNYSNNKSTDVGISLQYLPTFYVVATIHQSSSKMKKDKC